MLSITVPHRARAQARRWQRASTAIISAALVIGIAVRVLLAFVNVEANDPHLPIIRAIAFEHRFPTREQEWEGFQPKLYHTTVALVWRLLPTRAPYALRRAAQFVSCAAGIVTLLIVLRFLRLFGAMREGNRCAEAERGASLSATIAFAAVALNPALVGTSIQATNDAFVILFASLTFYSSARVLANGRGRDFVALVLWATLAGLSKGNGLVAIIAVAATFAIIAVIGPGAKQRSRAVIRGIVLAALVAPPVALIGPYYSYQQQYGTPFVTNSPPFPSPHLLHETFVARPGLTSVLQGLFTFRLMDLLRHPESNDDKLQYPRHRTSLWSRVYAQAHSAHFESWPPSWKARSPLVLQLTRALMLLGLVPSALVTWGFAALVRDTALGWRHSYRRRFAVGDDDALAHQWPSMLLLLIATASYLTFAAAYSIQIRDYSSMKVIFILPALLAFVAAFELGGARLLAWGAAERSAGLRALRRITLRAAALALALLLAGYAADLSVLAAQLADDRAAGLPAAF